MRSVRSIVGGIIGREQVRPRPAPPSSGAYAWLIVHGKDRHPAWYQRALLVGDFAPGLRPLPNYVLTLDGVIPEPSSVPRCGTCGIEPRVEDLTPVERETGQSHWLDRFRLPKSHPHHVPWRRAGRTDPETCYVCNSRKERISMAGGYVLVCDHCEKNLAAGGS